MATYADEERERQLDALLETFYVVNKNKLDWSKLEQDIMDSNYSEMHGEELQEFLWFMCNVIVRIWSAVEVLPLNLVKEDQTGFIIKNYGWKSYRWATKKGVSPDLILPNMIGIPSGLLNGEDIKRLRSKIK